MVSLRGANQHAAWCSNYEFEDVICGIDDVDLFSLKPESIRSASVVRALACLETGVRQLTPHLNPLATDHAGEGLRPVRLRLHEPGGPEAGLSAIKGWKDRCRKKISATSSSTPVG